jgi:hypothetical protein
LRDLVRVVGNDCAIEIDGNSYSVPWRLIGERVAVTVSAGRVRIRHGGRQVAAHEQARGRRQRIVDAAMILARDLALAQQEKRLARRQVRSRRLGADRSAYRLSSSRSRAASEASSDGGLVLGKRTQQRRRWRWPLHDRRRIACCTRRAIAGDAVEVRRIDQMLARLKLSGIRDQLDSLLDEMALKLAHFPAVKERAGFDFDARRARC